MPTFTTNNIDLYGKDDFDYYEQELSKHSDNDELNALAQQAARYYEKSSGPSTSNIKGPLEAIEMHLMK